MSNIDLSLFDLTGKSALVTGGAVGLGRACATALARAGARVAILDIDANAGAKTVRGLNEGGADTFFVKCNAADDVQITKAVGEVVSRLGRLDIAVNNAGTFAGGTDLEQSPAEWDRVFDLNLKGVWLCSRTEARQMINQSPGEGKIINIASMWGSVAGSNGSYCASKAGVIHLSKRLAVEWGAYNINVNCISPSWTMTPLLKMASEDFRQRVREVTPLGHVQRPEDIHGAVTFLASRASNYVTGLNLIVDGGHTLNTWHSPMERKIPPRVSAEEELSQLKEDLISSSPPPKAALREHGSVARLRS